MTLRIPPRSPRQGGSFGVGQICKRGFAVKQHDRRQYEYIRQLDSGVKWYIVTKNNFIVYSSSSLNTKIRILFALSMMKDK